jgi:multiple sugar transport system permease protein
MTTRPADPSPGPAVAAPSHERGDVTGSRPRSRYHHGAGRVRRVTVRRLPAHVVLLVAAVVFAYPLLWMIMSSFKQQSQIFSLTLWTDHPTLANYRLALNSIPLIRQFANSIVVAGCFTVGALLLCSAAGFAFAKLRFPGKRGLFLILVSTMMVPNFMTLLPAFLIMAQLGWVNTYQSVILPGIASAFGIFFMRQYMKNIPDELLDAARIDGAGVFGAFWRVAVPLSWPALGSLGILLFVAQWNNYLWPLVMLRTSSMQTVVLGVAALPNSNFSTPWGAVLAGASVAVVPLLIVFLVFQKRIIAGVMGGALKG